MKKILLGIVALICMCVLVEFLTYAYESIRLVRQGYTFPNSKNIPPYPTNIKTFSEFYSSDLNLDELLNNKSGTDYKTKPVLLFGDIYVNSHSTKDNMGKIISDTLKVPVYNLGNAGWTVSHMYYILKNEPKVSDYNPETIIFVYDSDQKQRMTSFSFYPHHEELNLRYKIVDDKLVEDNPSNLALYKSYFIRAVEKWYGWRLLKSRNIKNKQPQFDVTQKLFEESMNLAKEKYPNFKKFVILRVPTGNDSLAELKLYGRIRKVPQAEYKMWQNLKNDGFIIIDLTDFVENTDLGQANRLSDASLHPDFMREFMPDVLKVAELKPTILNNKAVINTSSANSSKNITKVPLKKSAKKVIINKAKSTAQNNANVEKNEEIKTITEPVNQVATEKPKKKFFDKFRKKNKD